MKTRNSLVSNSSSASFVIIWKYLIPGVDKLEDIIKQLFHDDGSNKKETIAKRTEILNGAFRTSFHTGMFNEYEDFGPDASVMMMALYLDSRFEIIDAKIDGEGSF